MTYDLTQLTRLGIDYADATALRRISMTLHRWYELECGGDENGCISREENIRWKVEVKARLIEHARNRLNCPSLDKTKYAHGSKEQALNKVAKELHQDGYEILAMNASIIEYDDGNGKPYWLNSYNNRRTRIADRERAAERRLDRIMSRYPTLSAYLQGDPRGCALYILRPGDVPEGAPAESYYSRGVAVYK